VNWFSLTSVILSAVTGSAVLAAVLTDGLAAPLRQGGRALRIFLVVLALNHAAGFLFYTFLSQDGFRVFLSGGSPAAGLLTLVLMIFEYGVFILSAFLVPRILVGVAGGSVGIRRFCGVVFMAGIAAASAGSVILVLRVTAVVSEGVILLADNALVIPLVYGIWIVSLFRMDKNRRPVGVFFIALIPAGLLERAASDPLWPVAPMVREILGMIPFTMVTVLVFSVLLTVSRFRRIRDAALKPVREPDFSPFALSPREEEIARLLLKGWANKDIARSLGISYGTVKNHIYALYGKMGIQSRYELIKKIP
jgi:DNA-binding CsgD family transcriptional regulator